MMKPNADDYNPDPDYIRALVDSAGMTQPVLASKLGVTDRTVRKWISGDRVAPYLAQFALECLVLNV